MNLNPLSSLSLGLFCLIGLVMIGISLKSLLSRNTGNTRNEHKGPDGHGENLPKELERLLSDISRGLRVLSSPARAGGLFYREKQEEVGRMLSELQGRLRLLDDGSRQPFEARAGHVLAQAAHAGITLPPLESPLITRLIHR